MFYTTADSIYKELVRTIFVDGVRKENRTGINTISCFGLNYTLKMDQGFPLLTTKYVDWKNIVLENLWFLSGQPHVEFLHQYGVKFWDPWVDELGNVPSAYGYEWRSFDGNKNVDQVRNALDLLKNSPDSRRIVITAWNPKTAAKSKLPPCHMTWVLNVLDGKLNLALLQRSCDIALGVPYNMAGYAFLLSLFAHLSGLKPGCLNHTLVDAHIYSGVVDDDEYDHRPGLVEQLTREIYSSPELIISPDIKSLDDVLELVRTKPPVDDILALFKLENYQHHPAIRFKVAV